MPTLHIQIHYQVAPAEPQTETWQRMWLSNCTKDGETHDRQKGQQLTAVWHNGGFSASNDNFVVGSSAVLRLNFCAKNRPLRQAANRYKQCLRRHDNDRLTAEN
jgi:hypothetical protein